SARPAAPMRTVAVAKPAKSAGSAWPSSASTKGSRPVERQACARRRGKSPLPATMPSLGAIGHLARTTERPARVLSDKSDQFLHRRRFGIGALQTVQSLRQRSDPRVEGNPVGSANCLDLIAREAPSPQTYEIGAGQSRAITDDDGVGHHIVLDSAHPADHGVYADPHKLVNRRKPAQNGMITDDDVAADRCVVRHDDVVADFAIMSDVGARHEQAIVAHGRLHPASDGARLHRHVLSDDIALADYQGG